jgi:hypothetical protein
VLENADLTHPATTQPIRRVSRTVTLPKVDGRSTLGKLMRQMRADLIRHVGGKPSAFLHAHALQLNIRPQDLVHPLVIVDTLQQAPRSNLLKN